jgi:hypothetical protein
MSRLDLAAVEGQAIRELQRYPMLARLATVTHTTPATLLSAHVTSTETADCNTAFAVTARYKSDSYWRVENNDITCMNTLVDVANAVIDVKIRCSMT